MAAAGAPARASTDEAWPPPPATTWSQPEGRRAPPRISSSARLYNPFAINAPSFYFPPPSREIVLKVSKKKTKCFLSYLFIDEETSAKGQHSK